MPRRIVNAETRPEARKVMAQIDSAFVGSVPENYDRHLGPMIFGPFATDLVARVVPFAPRRVLEIACGTGIVTRKLRDALPKSVEIVASDLNPPMLEIAKRKFEPAERVTTLVADATALPLEDAAFDAVVCQFGVMFFPEKATAFAEFFRVLRPGGRLLFNVWDSLDRNDGARIADAVLRDHYPSDPPTFFRTPFGFHDRAQIASMLQAAGFEAVASEVVAKSVVSPSALDAATGYVEGGPLAADLAARDAAAVATIREAVAKRFAEQLGDRPMRAQAQAIVFVGRRPG